MTFGQPADFFLERECLFARLGPNDFAQQVAQPGEGESGLGLRRPAGEHPVATLGGGLDAGQPERRLAESRLAREHGGAGTLLWVVEKADDRPELLFPAE